MAPCRLTIPVNTCMAVWSKREFPQRLAPRADSMPLWASAGVIRCAAEEEGRDLSREHSYCTVTALTTPSALRRACAVGYCERPSACRNVPPGDRAFLRGELDSDDCSRLHATRCVRPLFVSWRRSLVPHSDPRCIRVENPAKPHKNRQRRLAQCAPALRWRLRQATRPSGMILASPRSLSCPRFWPLSPSSPSIVSSRRSTQLGYVRFHVAQPTQKP